MKCGHITETRMHSSRMRTGRSLTVCCSLLPGGWGGLPPGGLLLGGGWSGGVCLRGGVVPGLGGLLRGGCLVRRGGLPPGGVVPGPGGGVCLPGGVCLVRREWVSQHALRQTPPLWTDTRLYKYYLGPTSLWPVTISLKFPKTYTEGQNLLILSF